jgi:hypothetical protein
VGLRCLLEQKEEQAVNKIWIALAITLAAVLHVVLVEDAYDTGYEDAEKALGTTAEQCFAWWFGDNTKQFDHELKQFCKKAQP